MRIIVHTDGNRYAGGAVAYDEFGNKVAERARLVSDGTVPICEYVGLLCGLELAVILGASEVTCMMDAELVQRHVTGEYACRDARLRWYLAQVQALRSMFDRAEVVLFPKAGPQRKRRYLNGDADALVARCVKIGRDIDQVFYSNEVR